MEALVTTLVTVVFLTRQLGENSTTPRDPVAVYDPEGKHKDITFEETTSCCLNSGDDRLVAVQLYGTTDVELPSWLDPNEWLHNRTAWKWAWGCGCDKTWPEAWQRFVAYDCARNCHGGYEGTARRLAAVKLLKVKKFRSEFRRSLRDRLEAWLATPANEREYASPFSFRQWECLTRYEHFEAKRTDHSLYYAGRYC